ncbi:MAG: SMC-Scp complex subunit ScpB, partial [Nocardioidaceae bacterium]
MTTTQATEPMADEATEPMADETTDELDPFADGATLPLRPSLEAVLMVADQPLDHLLLAQAVGAPPAEVAEALQALAAEYTEQGRGFDLRNTGGGWRFYSREEFAPVVEQFVVDGQQARLTQAALETLAV